ncbi:MAG: helix-turn-helix domain-containing protein [Terriglobia bacterium]|jgi:transposase
MSPSSRRDAKRHILRAQGTLNPRPQEVAHALFQESDFFDPRDLLQVKYEMLRQVRVENQAVSHAAEAFGFSRPSFYLAQAGFAARGLAGLIPQKRGPRHAHKLTAEVMEFVQQARAAAPSLRSEELAARVKKAFRLRVHPRSLERRLGQQQKERR